MTRNYIKDLNSGYCPESEENVYKSIFNQYERVVVESLITSFGLDFLVTDQYGGDVDTIHNVRKIDHDENMTYKNQKNKEAYEQRETYKYGDYHNGKNYHAKGSVAKSKFREDYKTIKDEYTGGDIGFYGKTKAVPSQKKATLDHIISTKEIHNDRGRVLSGVDGKLLADSETNLAWTNGSLNSSIREKANSEYVKSHPELDKTTSDNMLAKDKQARKEYNATINQVYYTSSLFIKDTAKAAGKVGFQMGLRQALGLIFSEIWFSVKEQIIRGKEYGEALFNSIACGVKKGFENAKNKFKDIWDKFIEGTIAGILSSLVTTLCNIFFTTAKSFIRILRQTWASLVEATKVLLFNPDDLPFGERFRAATKVIATGASIVAGSMVAELISKTPVVIIPMIGEIVQTFCGTLVTGIMSCSLLYLLDNSPLINEAINKLNKIPTIENTVAYYKKQSEMLELYCAELMNIDIERFKTEINSYNDAMSILETCTNDVELREKLSVIYVTLKIDLPWNGYDTFNNFMDDPQSKLNFC